MELASLRVFFDVLASLPVSMFCAHRTKFAHPIPPPNYDATDDRANEADTKGSGEVCVQSSSRMLGLLSPVSRLREVSKASAQPHQSQRRYVRQELTLRIFLACRILTSSVTYHPLPRLWGPNFRKSRHRLQKSRNRLQKLTSWPCHPKFVFSSTIKSSLPCQICTPHPQPKPWNRPRSSKFAPPSATKQTPTTRPGSGHAATSSSPRRCRRSAIWT